MTSDHESWRLFSTKIQEEFMANMFQSYIRCAGGSVTEKGPLQYQGRACSIGGREGFIS